MILSYDTMHYGHSIIHKYYMHDTLYDTPHYEQPKIQL
jgi:hypothetical protein